MQKNRIFLFRVFQIFERLIKSTFLKNEIKPLGYPVNKMSQEAMIIFGDWRT